jgi:S-adenosylmethionine decarboxylase
MRHVFWLYAHRDGIRSHRSNAGPVSPAASTVFSHIMPGNAAVPSAHAALPYPDRPAPAMPQMPKMLHAIDASTTPATPVTDLATLTAAAAGAVRAGHGHVVGSSHVVFPNGAITLVLILAESHLSIHTWPEEDLIAIDLFCCGAMDSARVIGELVSVLALEGVSVSQVPRGARAARG